MATLKIIFHRNDDLSQEYRDRVEGSVLTTEEAATTVWGLEENRVTLRYRTMSSPLDALAAWENEGFYTDEFYGFQVWN